MSTEIVINDQDQTISINGVTLDIHGDYNAEMVHGEITVEFKVRADRVHVVKKHGGRITLDNYNTP